jgi:hypothetical protein
MSSNGQAHKPVLVACRRSQHRARMSHQPRHRPDGSDSDVRDRVGHQASAVGADTGAAILPQLGQRVQRRGPHAANVVIQGRSQLLDGPSVREGAECADRGEPVCRSLVLERRGRDS